MTIAVTHQSAWSGLFRKGCGGRPKVLSTALNAPPPGRYSQRQSSTATTSGVTTGR